MKCGILQITKAFSTDEFIDRFVAWYQGSTAGDPFSAFKNSDDDEIVYFTVRWKTRKLVLSTAPKHEITPTSV